MFIWPWFLGFRPFDWWILLKIFQLKGLKSKNNDQTNFYECCDLTKKVYLMFTILTQLWHYVDCWKCQEYFHSFVFLPSQDQKEERDIVCGGMHGDIYLQHQPICTSLGRWIITFHLATPQKTLNAIIGEKNGCHYGMVWS